MRKWISTLFEETPVLGTVFIVSIVLLIIVSLVTVSLPKKGGSCDVPSCNNSASCKGHYGGTVFLCKEHEYVRYYFDPSDNSLNFNKEDL